MALSKRESRLFVALCAFDVAKSISLFLLVAQLCEDSSAFWRRQLVENMRMSTSLSDLLLVALLRVTLLCGIYVSDGAGRQVALSVAYISFRILTLVGSIYLAMKLAFFDYHALGNSGATACAVLMIVGSLVALWVESVVPYVLTAARLPDADDSQLLLSDAPVATSGDVKPNTAEHKIGDVSKLDTQEK